MRFNLLILAFGCALSAGIHAQLVISEVYANEGRRGEGQEWFEVYNIGSRSVSLEGAYFKRLDGQALNEAWRVQLPSNNFSIDPQHYALIAQRKDLGMGFCFNVPVVTISDPVFRLKNSGFQTLCLKTSDGIEDCAQFSNSLPFPMGHSRYNLAPTLRANDDLGGWRVEDCEISPGIHASPGSVGGFCHQGSKLPSSVVSCDDDVSSGMDDPILSMSLASGGAPNLVRFDVEQKSEESLLLKYEISDPDLNDAFDLSIQFSAVPDATSSFTVMDHAPISDRKGEITWNTLLVPEGVYYLFALLHDRVGHQSRRLGQKVEVKRPKINLMPQLELLAAQIKEHDQSYELSVSWKLSSSKDGNLALFIADEPIMAGITPLSGQIQTWRVLLENLPSGASLVAKFFYEGGVILAERPLTPVGQSSSTSVSHEKAFR